PGLSKCGYASMCATRAGHRSPSGLSRDLFDLRDRVAIVTGSGRGLGKAMAAGLADAGASVVVCARHADEVEEAAAAISAAGGSAFPTQVDTRDRESCRRLVETT